jgi:prepilin peptidase CpaA
MMAHTMASHPMLLAGVAVGVAAMVSDIRHRSLPNWLTGAGMAAGLLLHAANGGWRGLAFAAAGAALGFAILLPFHLLGTMGGGDVKLMAAFGALLGPAGILPAAVLAAIFGGVWAVVWLAFQPRAAAIPYAPAIVLGAWASWIGGGS